MHNMETDDQRRISFKHFFQETGILNTNLQQLVFLYFILVQKEQMLLTRYTDLTNITYVLLE